MRITRIEPLGKRRSAVYFNLEGEELYMPLYAGELKHYHMEEEAELPDETFEEICTKILNPRAMQRGEYLLASKWYTAAELTNKFRENRYPECVITYVLDRFTEYGFIDDRRYAKRYVESVGKKKSVKQLRLDLTRKGIDRAILDDLLSDPAQETTALTSLIEKRCKNSDLSDPKEWNKQVRYLMGKGFSYDMVKEELLKRVKE